MFGSNKKEIELLTQQLAKAQEALVTEKSISARTKNQLREAEQKNSDQMKQLVAVEVQQQEQAKELQTLRQLVEMNETMFLQFPGKWIRFDEIRSFSVDSDGHVTELAGHRLSLTGSENEFRIRGSDLAALVTARYKGPQDPE